MTETSSDTTIPSSVDVVVVGAGMAGFCAAISAAESGASVLLVEKGDRVGGSMALSGGFVWTLRSVEHARRLIPGGNELLQELVVEGLAPGLEWLAAHGVQLGEEEPLDDTGIGRTAQPPQMAGALHDAAKRAGVRVALSSPLVGLSREDGAVVGAVILSDGREVLVRSSAVVLASGGFQGNPELVQRYITPYADSVYVRGNPWSTGDGLLAGLDAGAAVSTGLGTFYGHAMSAPPARIGPLHMMEATQRYGNWSVALNLNGQRFADESAGTGEEVLDQAVARQPNATAAYVIDGAIEQRQAAWEHNPLARVMVERAAALGGPVVSADTLEELCAGLEAWGIPGAVALKTIREYNAAIVEDRTGELLPPRRLWQAPILEPPFTAALVRAGITFTTGGLEVDTDMAVLRRATSSSPMPLSIAQSNEYAAEPIVGLFAAGADIGGVHNVGYMGGLSTALATGQIAGQSAASAAGH